MPKIEVIIAKDGNPVPVLDGITLHSRYAPVEEGKKLADRFLAQHTTAKEIAVFGLGFYYHIEPLAGHYSKIHVYEPNQEMIEQMSRHRDNAIPSHVRVSSELADFTGIGDLPLYDLAAMRRKYPNHVENLLRTMREKKVATAVRHEIPDYRQIRVLIDFPVYGGSLTTAEYITNAFTRLGCEVKTVDNTIANSLLLSFLATDDRIYAGQMSSKLTSLLSDIFLHEVERFQPHICFFPAQSPVTIPLLQHIRQMNKAVTAFWFVEDYRRFAYWKDYAPHFEKFYGIQRNPFLDQLRQLGATAPSYLPMAADEAVHRPLYLTPEEIEEYGADVAFMGAGYPNRREMFAQLLDYDLKIWGTDWDHPKLQDVVQREGARICIEESVKIYNATKININLHSSMNRDLFEIDGDFINPRTFEIMACGGFQLVDKRLLLPELFTEGEEIVTFASLNELREKIDYYLEHPAERKRIAEAGRRKVLQHHTYTHRIRSVLNDLLRDFPRLGSQLVQEKGSMDDFLRQANDPELRRFIQSLPPEKRRSLPALVEAVKEQKGRLHDYQAILLLLDTFYRNES